MDNVGQTDSSSQKKVFTSTYHYNKLCYQIMFRVLFQRLDLMVQWENTKVYSINTHEHEHKQREKKQAHAYEKSSAK